MRRNYNIIQYGHSIDVLILKIIREMGGQIAQTLIRADCSDTMACCIFFLLYRYISIVACYDGTMEIHFI